MKVGIVWNTSKTGVLDTVAYVVDWFQSKGIDISLNEKDMYSQELAFIVVLGGDGTILNTVKAMEPYSLPLLGINLGNLGFLTAIERDGIDEYLAKAVEGTMCQIEERMMLDVNIYEGEKIIWSDSALNDVVLSRESLSRILNFSVEVTENFIGNYFADGYILATATGSTAYSLSAGGPILTPKMKAVVLTPICAHTLYARPMVVSNEEMIKLALIETTDDGVVTIDGQRRCPLSKGQELRVEASKNTAKIMRFSNRGFFQVLSEKIGSRG